MIKLSMCSLMYATFSLYCMTLENLHSDELDKIFHYVDPQARGVRLKGDIAFVSSTKFRTKSSLLTYDDTKLENTNLKIVACVNKNLFQKVFLYLNKLQNDFLVKKAFYENEVSSFLQNKKIIFFEDTVKYNQHPWNITFGLDLLDVNANRVSYEFYIMMKPEKETDYNDYFNYNYFYRDRFCKMLSLCINHCVLKTAQNKQMIDYSKIENFFKKNNKKITNIDHRPSTDDEGNGAILTCGRDIKNNDNSNWIIFSLELFIECLALNI